jgi:ComF family protein
MLNIRELTNQLVSPLLDFIYPPICISCNRPLQDGKQKVCGECWNAIPIITKEHPLYQETRSKLLAEGSINDLVSCFIFEREGPFQHIAHALKYKEYKSCGIELGRRMGILIKDWNIETDIIIPVPLHRIKQRERGYNQSEFIAQGIASIIEKPIEMNAVHRTCYTQTQTKLNLEQRRENIKDAFKAVSGASTKLKGKKCLLVDDIITTGATANECAKELLAAGAATIIAASAALAK